MVIPRKVTDNGTFLSHDLTHHHFEDFEGNFTARRVKRSTGRALLNYHIPVRTYEEPLHVELWPSVDFISPQLVVERRSNSEHRRYHAHGRHCHYQGAIRGQANSQVAVSACDGLVSPWICLY